MRYPTFLSTFSILTNESKELHTLLYMPGFVVHQMVSCIMVRIHHLQEDCDDNGEAAAGGRLAHLLFLLVCTLPPNHSGN